MAQNVSIIPEKITSADALDEILTISDLITPRMSNPILLIEIISGTWKFGVGELASNSSASYGAGEKLDLQLRAADRTRPQLKLNIQAANAAETFRISAIGR